MDTKRVHFTNEKGQKLAAKLELPIDKKPEAFAIFAHCFTCNMNLNAVQHISTALTERGFGVLRFDFTGLGQSEGDFADTNFSSNVQDLICAAGFLREYYQAPKLIIGHSLGGTAAIFAGSVIESIQAIATIGAPSSPVHVKKQFGEYLETILSENQAEVELAGRPFTIKKQFIEDLQKQDIKAVIDELRKPILILHSPQDNTVSIHNAAKLYEKAIHPKSFVSLDGADHLLSNKQDSLYVGSMIASWAKRYVDIIEDDELKTDHHVVAQIRDHGYTTELKAGIHSLIADEPKSVGGDNFGPSPYGYLLSALGSCTAMTMRMYADRKGWKVNEINVHLSHTKDYAKDCEACEASSNKIDLIERVIEIDADLTAEQKEKLMAIADKCPVHRTLHNTVQVKTAALND
jgi:putative redox protein